MAKIFTAAEVVEFAGQDPKKIGKVRVRIGGIPVNRPDHVINFGDAKKVDLIVGVDSYEAELPSQDGLSSDAQKVKEKEGRARSKAYAEARKAKAEPTEEPAEPDSE